MKIIISITLCVINLIACKQRPVEQIHVPKNEHLPFYTGPDFTPYWFNGDIKIPESIHRIPAFSFTDQNGNIITDKTADNKIYVADFFFTSCSGICPKLTKNLKLIQDAFKDDPGVMLLSYSVMPHKDIPAALKRYAVNYGVMDNKWFLLTGNKDSIYALARKGYFADEDLGMKRDTNDFLHTENVLLIDTKRRIRGIYKGTYPSEMKTIIEDIDLLKKEKP